MKLRYYSQRWGHDDFISITRTDTGWNVQMNTTQGDCDQKGVPVLYDILQNDQVDYPADLGGYLEHLWMHAQEDSLSEEAIQQHLDLLSKWIEATERAKPSAEIWSDY